MLRPPTRMPFTRRSRVAAVALVGLITAGVLSACQSEATPPGTASPSAMVTSASPSPSASSPTPSASPSVDIPAAAREKSDKGAEAFVRFFFDQVNVAWTTPTPKPIEASSEPGCKSCESLIGTAKDLQQKMHHYSTEPVAVKGTRPVAGAPEGQRFVEVDLAQNQVDVVDAKGKVISTDKKARFVRTVAVIWKDDRWLVYDVA